MDSVTLTVIGLIILALVVIAFFLIFRGKGNFKLEGPGGFNVTAEGENPPPNTTTPSGVKVKGAEAGRNLTVHSTSEGGVDVENVSAQGDVRATHIPKQSSPK